MYGTTSSPTSTTNPSAPAPDDFSGEIAAPEYCLSPERLPAEEVRVSLSRVITASGFGAAFSNLTAGAVYVAFARTLGANEFVFGVLAAALPLMSFLQVLSARLVERTRRRKLQMVVAGILSRLLWVVAALLPLIAQLFPELLGKQRVLPFVVGCILLSGVFQAFSSPAFFSWMADLIPGRVRTSFFVRRMQIGTAIALVTSLAGGFIADKFPNLTAYSIILALAGVAGVLDVALFIGVRDPPPSPRIDADGVATDPQHTPPFWASLIEPLRDPAIRTFFIFVSFTMLSAGLIGPFMWLHSLEHLNMSKTTTGLMLTVAPLLGVVWSSRFWGEVIKRHGNRPVMRVVSVGLILVPLYWMAVRPSASGIAESWGTFIVMTVITGTLWAGLELTNHNLLLGLSPHIPRSTLTALFSITTGLSFAAAAWLGGAVAHWLTLIDFEYEVFGVEIIKYHILFSCALVLRLINAILIAPRLREPASSGTIDTVKEIVPEMIDSFAARLRWPFGAREE